MASQVFVSIPAAMADRMDSEAVMIRSESTDEIVRAYRILGDRLKEVELHGLENDVSGLSELPAGLPLTVRLHPGDAARLYTSSWLADRFPLVVLMDVDRGLLQGVRIVSSAMVPVTLNLDELHHTGELAATLLFYLHEPHLQVPVEFFHSMFDSILRKAPLSLADIYPESPDKVLYVDESGRVTCSSRLARSGMFFGEVSNGLRIDEGSPQYKLLVERKKHLFLSHSTCTSCEQFDLCQGYLRLVEHDLDCDPFLHVFAQVKNKAAEIARDLSNAGLSEH